MLPVLDIFAARDGRWIDAVALLRPYRVPVTVAEAVAYLEGIVEPVKMLALYKHFFPREFARSKAESFPVGRQLYSDKEVEFFNLIQERFFPLAYWFCDEECNAMEEREVLIPVWPETMILEDQELWDFRFGWQILFVISGTMRDGKIGEVDEADSGVIERAAALPELNPRLFQHILRAFEEAPGPLQHVPMALRMVDHSTDCVWHDAYPDLAYGPTIEQPWSIEGIEWLRDEYELAQEITANVESLLDWIEASHENRLQLLEIWESAVRSEENAVVAAAEEQLLDEEEEEDGAQDEA